jgi:hypothetical protein
MKSARILIRAVTAVFALGLSAAYPAWAAQCNTTVADTQRAQCKSASDASESTHAITSCKRAAESTGACAQENVGPERAHDFILQGILLYTQFKAYMKLGYIDEAKGSLAASIKVLNIAAKVPGATADQKSQATIFVSSFTAMQTKLSGSGATPPRE